MKKRFGTSLLYVVAVMVAVIAVLTAGAASAMLKVNVMPSGVTSKTNIWDSGPYTWPGNNLELWGNVAYDGAGTLTYTWNFGAGEGSASGTVSNRNNIAASHTYGSTGNYVATLTVTDGVQTDSDTVYIDVVPQTFDVRKNLAIERALKYVYMSRVVWTVNGCDTFYWSSLNWPADTILAVLAFEDYGHRESNDHDKDIYAETVERGLDAVFAQMRRTPAAHIPNSDSDINGNGWKIYNGYGDMYQHGMIPMPIANTYTPNALVSCAEVSLNGKTYKEVLEDMVDYLAYAQEERSGCSGYGGWRYGANYCSSDNSVSQWPTLGLASAEGAKDLSNTSWGISAPSWVKAILPNWINYSQCSGDGGFGYSDPCYYGNVAKTGAGIIEMEYAGSGGNQANALSYMNTYWGTYTGGWLYHYNIGYPYAMYAVKKGMQYAGLSHIGAHDWQSEYNNWYVTNQINSGTNGVYFPNGYWVSGSVTTSIWGLLVMAPGLADIPPVANAGVDKDVTENQNVSFSGSASYHPDPGKTIVLYEWDFDYNGINFTVDATGENVTKVGGYQITNGTDTQVFTVGLRVTDNAGLKSQIDTAVVTVSNGNVAPVADPGGPYLAAVGEVVTLDGSGSYDDNEFGGANPLPSGCGSPAACDRIVSYQWDLDGDGQYDDATGVNPTISFGTTGTRNIGLKVTDTFGKSAAQSSNVTTVAVSDLYPVSYTLVSNVYNRMTRKFTTTWKVNITNRGNAAATAVSAVWTGSSIPAGVTVLDSSVSWTGSIDPGETQLSDDTFRYISTSAIDKTGITWDITFTDSLGQQHVIRNIPQ